MDKIEFLILKNLLNNEDYMRKVVPFVKADYFEDSNQRVVFEEIFSFVSQYNEVPTREIVSIEVEKRKDLNETTLKEVSHLIGCLDETPVEYEWLLNKRMSASGVFFFSLFSRLETCQAEWNRAS